MINFFLEGTLEFEQKQNFINLLERAITFFPRFPGRSLDKSCGRYVNKQKAKN